MDRVPVYAFNYFDRASGEWMLAPDLATETAIREMAGKVMPDTAQEVSLSEVGRSGLVRRVRW